VAQRVARQRRAEACLEDLEYLKVLIEIEGSEKWKMAQDGV